MLNITANLHCIRLSTLHRTHPFYLPLVPLWILLYESKYSKLHFCQRVRGDRLRLQYLRLMRLAGLHLCGGVGGMLFSVSYGGLRIL